jgi:uncharacterized ferritin-like protein (DUF455 family)
MIANATDLRLLALQRLQSTNLEEKTAMSAGNAQFFATHSVAPDVLHEPTGPIPGRPAKPELLAPGQVPKRSPHTRAGRAALVHAIAHIEWNAINLAWDAVWRFNGMPEAYYRDWARVAAEESEHFGLLRGLLQHMGYDYGDFPGHDGLWAMTEKTAGDVTARMALVPRTLEARGLDATPLIQAKLRAVAAKPQKSDPHAADDAQRACAILDRILADEIGHVAIGNHWYRWLCERQGLDPVAHYAWLTERYDAPKLKPPFNTQARLMAGFDDAELHALGQL